jgi:patatin-like phospholipase/acyl hydrolase
MEEALGVQVRECFNLVCGTSTGAIIAGAIAVGIEMEKIVRLFEGKSALVFQRRPFRWPLIRSKYGSEPLVRLVRSAVPDVSLGEISTPLLITSSDVSTGGVHVFKSRYLESLGEPYVRDGRVQLCDAILASCAAPTYFDPVCVGEHTLADGGLWANNPSIIALVEAVSKFKKPIEQIRILSIGTGHSINLYGRSKLWGLLTGWGRQKLISYFLGLQSQASTNMSKLLLRDRHFRLDPEIENWDLDDIEHLDNLKSLAAKDFAHNSMQIEKFIRRV